MTARRGGRHGFRNQPAFCYFGGAGGIRDRDEARDQPGGTLTNDRIDVPALARGCAAGRVAALHDFDGRRDGMRGARLQCQRRAFEKPRETVRVEFFDCRASDDELCVGADPGGFGRIERGKRL